MEPKSFGNSWNRNPIVGAVLTVLLISGSIIGNKWFLKQYSMFSALLNTKGADNLLIYEASRKSNAPRTIVRILKGDRQLTPTERITGRIRDDGSSVAEPSSPPFRYLQINFSELPFTPEAFYVQFYNPATGESFGVGYHQPFLFTNPFILSLPIEQTIGYEGDLIVLPFLTNDNDIKAAFYIEPANMEDNYYTTISINGSQFNYISTNIDDYAAERSLGNAMYSPFLYNADNPVFSMNFGTLVPDIPSTYPLKTFQLYAYGASSSLANYNIQNKYEFYGYFDGRRTQLKALTDSFYYPWEKAQESFTPNDFTELNWSILNSFSSFFDKYIGYRCS